MSTATFQPSHTNSQLQSDWLYLHAQMPPAKWAALPSFGSAATWLGMHHSLRRGQGELEHLCRQFLDRRMDWPDFRQRLLAVADGHYSHLHGHHRLEDRHYFPKFRQREPRLQAGFDLLDSDHARIEEYLHQIHGLLAQLQVSGQASGQVSGQDHAQTGGADDAATPPPPAPALIVQLSSAIEKSGRLLYRHLMDEEDLVIPIIALQE